MTAALGTLWRSITRVERKALVATVLVVIVVTSIPPLVGWSAARQSGSVWTGRQFLAPSDFTVYLSAIDQAKSWRLLTENLFTTEPSAPVFNILWYSVGRLADLFSLSPLQAFHLARLLLIPPLAVVSYLLIAFFLTDRRYRLAAFLLFMFGSGLGSFAAPFLPYELPRDGNYAWPIDFWVAEANTFMIMTYSPHFVASLALWLLSLLLVAVSFEKKSLRTALAAGTAALLLFQFHPYHAPVLYAVAGAWCLLAVLRDGWRTAPWPQFVAFVIISVPSVAYHYAVTHADDSALALLSTNYTLTPSLFHVMVGFGAISVLWYWGANIVWRESSMLKARLALLVAWIAVQSLMLYSPFRFQRRFLEGLQFPLTVLSVPALFALYAWLIRVKRVGRVTAMIAGALVLAAVFLTSTALTATRNISLYLQKDERFFSSKADDEAMRWFRSETPAGTVILAHPDTGNLLAAQAGRRLYAGHWSATIDIERKTSEIVRFYRLFDDGARAEFMRDNGITHAYLGWHERELGAKPFGDAFTRVFSSGDVDVYVLKSEKL